MSKPKAKHIPTIPIEIAIEITSACNLNCKICLTNKEKKINISFNKIKKIVDEAKSLNIEAIRITGGEPLLHKEIIQILEYIKSKGFYLILNTNGTLLTDTVIKKLEKCIDNILISIQGYNSSSEEQLTGGGKFFKEKIKNLAKLSRSKIRMVRADTIISRTLINNLDKYRLIFTTLGIRNWVTNRPMPAKNNLLDNEYNISKKDILKVMDFMVSLRKIGINTNLGNAIPFCITNDSKKMLLLTSNGLTEGHRRIIYDINSFYKPSYKISVNIGNTIKQAMKNSFLKKIKSLEYLPEKCQQCIYLKNCLGGSRYLAYKSSGNYFKPDPWIEI